MEINFENIDKLFNLKIKYENLKDTLKESLFTNLTSKPIIKKLYINIFNLDIIGNGTTYEQMMDTPIIPELNCRLYNSYFSLLSHIYQDCHIKDLAEHLDDRLHSGTDFIEFYRSLIPNTIFNIKNEHVSISDLLEFNNENLTTNNDNLRLFNTQINRYCNDLELKYTNAFWEYPDAIQYTLFLKVLYKFINPDREISDSKFGNLTILDFDPTITDEDKNLVLNICKVYTKWIFRKNLKDEETITELFDPTNSYLNYLRQYISIGLESFVDPNTNTVENDSFRIVLTKVNAVIHKIKNFLFTVFLDEKFTKIIIGDEMDRFDTVETSSRKVNKIISNIFNYKLFVVSDLAGDTPGTSMDFYICRFEPLELIEYLSGINVSLIHSKNIDKFNYIDDIISLDECFNIETIINPLIKSCVLKSNKFNYVYAIKEVFENFKNYLNENVFIKFIKEENLKKKEKLLLNIFSLSQDSVKLRLPLKKERKILLNTQIDLPNEELFDSEKDSSITSCPQKLEKFRNVLNITKQAYRGITLEPLHNIFPGFYERYFQYTGNAAEKGYSTGPTKQLMGEFVELFNYVIRYDEVEKKINYYTPPWVGNTEKEKHLFYSFMTQFLLTAMSLNNLNLEPYYSEAVPVKFDFYLTFNMLVPTLISIMKTPLLKLNSEPPEPAISDEMREEYNSQIIFLNKLFDNFDSFINIYDFKKELFLKEDGTVKYESLDMTTANLTLYYRSICLYLIGDLLQGGADYKNLKEIIDIDIGEKITTRDWILDPDNSWLDERNQMYKLPNGFLDFRNIDNFYAGGKIYNARYHNDYNIFYNGIELIVIKLFLIHKKENILTSEKLISSIRFENIYDSRYDVIFDYMKKLIRDYSIDLPNEVVEEIKNTFPTQLDFINKLLKTWTASNSLRDTTILQFVLENQPSIQIATCYNSLVFPVNTSDYTEISYQDFVAGIIGICSGADTFGIHGGSKKTKLKKINSIKKNKMKLLNSRSKKTNKNK